MGTREFALPDLGEGLDEAEVTTWLVGEGERVALNQPLVEVETAKATVEIPSPFAGIVRRLHVAAGVAVKVGDRLVTFEVEGAASNTTHAAARTDGIHVTGRETRHGEAATTSGSRRVASSPAARKLAKDLGMDLASVRGTGPGGRITREDVEAAGANRRPSPDGPQP
jgi:pyruvate/2-oxoglutarate dehydrogenase complex dihydrolipoamide acyltransferase (E2) component